jgi:hypothetical protein
MAAAEPMDGTALLAMLSRLASEPRSTVYLQPPASEAAIAAMQAAASRELGDAVPGGYLALLRASNGLQINGAYFKEAENLVPENLDAPREAVIVLGNQGNVSECVFDRRDGRFHIVAMGAEDERLASFDTFAEMLLAVMRDEQVL